MKIPMWLAVEKLFKDTGFTLSGERAVLRKVFTKYKEFVFIASRGTGKSQSQAAKILYRMLVLANKNGETKGFRQLYVSPSEIQSTTFVKQNLDPLILGSPIVRSKFVNLQKMTQVTRKEMTNGSVTEFRHAGDAEAANKIRGLHVDVNIFDEVQDMDRDVIDILSPTIDNSKYAIREFTGTFKTQAHLSYVLWEQSDQHEWGIKCSHCGKWNVPLDQYNIGKDGPICRHCGKRIYREEGQWIRMNPTDKSGNPNPIFGIRFSHLMAPYMPWERVWNAYRGGMQFDKFLNEVVGLPTDVIDIPITEAELIAACNESIHNFKDNPTKKLRSSYRFVAGIDWQGEHTYTVVTIIAVTESGPYVYAMKRFTGHEASHDNLIPSVIKFLKQWDPVLIFADWGMGHDRNPEIERTFGPNRFAEIEYSGNLKRRIKWNRNAGHRGRYLVGRTDACSYAFHRIKHGDVRFFRYSDFKEFKDDFLSLFKEENERTGNIMYRTNASKTDDAFHSFLYALLAYDTYTREIGYPNLTGGGKQVYIDPKLKKKEVDPIEDAKHKTNLLRFMDEDGIIAP